MKTFLKIVGLLISAIFVLVIGVGFAPQLANCFIKIRWGAVYGLTPTLTYSNRISLLALTITGCLLVHVVIVGMSFQKQTARVWMAAHFVFRLIKIYLACLSGVIVVRFTTPNQILNTGHYIVGAFITLGLLLAFRHNQRKAISSTQPSS